MIAKKRSDFMTGLLDVTVLIAGLGYMVDMFDLLLFNVVRVKSLTDLGLEGDAITSSGLFIVNCQMAGLLIGAYLWGVIADKFGRRPGLFASITVYSLGALMTAFVSDVDSYALARFITAVGLAGELGAGITLISEKLKPEQRGAGVMLFISMGFLGVLLAALGAEFIYWRWLYVIGGVSGLLLLLCRVSIKESGVFGESLKHKVQRGGFVALFKNPDNRRKYVAALLLMTPPIFISQILWALSPEIARALGVVDAVKPNIVILVCFSAAIVGDFFAAVLSEKTKSRRKAVFVFLAASVIVFCAFLAFRPGDFSTYIAFNILCGFFLGYWVVGGVWIAEQFGTNVRATAATTIPNFARASVIPMNMAFAYLKGFDTMMAVAVVGIVVFILAITGWMMLKETYGRDVSFIEPDVIP